MLARMRVIFFNINRNYLGLGFDLRSGFGTNGPIEYYQYIDAGIRFEFNHYLNEKFMVSGIFYPIWIQVRETELPGSTVVTGNIPSAVVAVTWFF